MNGIQSIRIKNFKAFSKEEEIKLNGKNLLVYGENGSGKSSLYFALYTFLQCSNPNKRYGKYFARRGNESLLNLHTLSQPSHIEVVAKGEGTRSQTFHLSARRNNLRSSTLINEMNLSSDFISHRLLINFYNFRNSRPINLFSVFERDIFPYFTLTTPNGTEYFSEVFDRLKNELPVNNIRRKKVLIPSSMQRYIDYETLLNTFNRELKALIQTVNSQATNYYKDNFNEGKDEIQIFIELNVPLSMHDVIDYTELKDPLIKLYIKQKVGTHFKKVDRPQSYLNEARLTAVALSIRFALMERRPTQLPTKILALDDLLVSLDMSHRENVLNLVLDKYSNQYQLIILTHDRQFFYMAKNHIKIKHDLSKWSLYEMYADNRKGFERPFITEFKTSLEKAQGFMFSFQFSAAANALRSELEEFLQALLPIEEQVDENGFRIKDFTLLDKAIAFLKKGNIVTTDIELIKTHKDISLNPLSHFDIEKNTYQKELNDCIKLLSKIELQFKKFKTRKILKANDELNFQLTEGADTHSFTVTLKGNVYLFTQDGITFSLTTTSMKLVWLRNATVEQHNIRKSNLVALLNEVCTRTHNPVNQDPFAVYKLANGALLNTLKHF